MKRALTSVLALLSLLTTIGLASSGAAGAPRGVHLALGADPKTSMTVVWFTDTTTDPGTVVEYGPTVDLGSAVTGTALKAPGVIALVHEVSLTGLTPGQTVYYRAGSPGSFSPIRSFHTAPAGAAPFTFTMFSDHGTRPASSATALAAAADEPDLSLMSGDLSYANGTQRTWDTWFNIIEPLASKRPLMTTMGNHEYNGDALTYRARFAYPGAETYYSYDYANVHFLVLNSTLSGAATDRELAQMYAFAEQDLLDASQRKAAGQIDFIAVSHHHPLFGNMAADATGVAERQQNPPLIALEERMLQLYDVDLLLAGHNHHYERSKPMIVGQPTTTELHEYTDPSGYIEIISGGGGESLYSFRDPNDFADWSAAYAKCLHYMRFSVNGKRLTGEMVVSGDPCIYKTEEYPPGTVIDSFSITRS
jgi:acid phosphatase type 7